MECTRACNDMYAYGSAAKRKISFLFRKPACTAQFKTFTRLSLLRNGWDARAQASLRNVLASLAPHAWSDECPYTCNSALMRRVLLPFCAIACRVGSMSEGYAMTTEGPFYWGAPACYSGFWNVVNVGDFFLCVPDASFTIPDVQLPSCGCCEPGKPKLGKPMLRPKLCDSFRGLVCWFFQSRPFRDLVG